MAQLINATTPLEEARGILAGAYDLKFTKAVQKVTAPVYDKVKDNQGRLSANGDMTYTEMMNLSLNQTFMRSINTTLSAVLPVIAILVIGAGIMGAVTLEEFGLALLVGMIAGAYSSVFIASPIVAKLKEREPRYIQIRERVLARRVDAGATPVVAGAPADGAAAASVSRPLGRPCALRPARFVSLVPRSLNDRGSGGAPGRAGVAQVNRASTGPEPRPGSCATPVRLRKPARARGSPRSPAARWQPALHR